MIELPAIWGSAAAVLLLAVAWQPWRRSGERRVGPWAGALAPAVGSIVALYVNAKSLELPPATYLDWVLLAGVAAAPLGVLAGGGFARAALAGLLAGALGFAVAWYPTETLRTRFWEDDTQLWLAALTLAFTLAALGARGLVARRPAWLGLGILAASALGASIALGESGTGNGGLVMAPLAAAAGAAAALALWRPDLGVERALTLPFAVLHVGLVSFGVLYASLERVPAVLLIAAPLQAALAGGTGDPRRWAALRALLALAFIGAALYLALDVGAPAVDDPYADT